MAAIKDTIEIARRSEEVFAYLDDIPRHGEWQDQIVSVRVDTDGPTRVGTRATETRRVGGRNQQLTYEITEHSPPRSFAFRGLNGPLRPVGGGVLEPIGDGSRCRLTVELDFEAHGIGKLLRPLAVRQARKQVVKDQRKLKERLESGAA
jgi:uncharacterized membrane protein